VHRAAAAPRPLLAAAALAYDGIPTVALAAYRHAADLANREHPACGLPWPLLAAIGRVESDHGRFAGSVLLGNGLSSPRIIGVQLNGHGTARVFDTDRGVLDGDPVYDRAVGPMQFIPSTWARYAADGNGDGVADPFNIYDAARAAANYLCAAGTELRSPAGQVRAVLSYNQSGSYVASVLGLEALYGGTPVLVVTVPVGPAPGGALPPVNPGAPPAITANADRPAAAIAVPPPRGASRPAAPPTTMTTAITLTPSGGVPCPRTTPSPTSAAEPPTTPAQLASTPPSGAAPPGGAVPPGGAMPPGGAVPPGADTPTPGSAATAATAAGSPTAVAVSCG
jgi:hypothetical protein